MKRFITILITLILIFSLSGCSESATQEQQNKLISSDDYQLKTASIINWGGNGDRFDIRVVSWKMVNDDLIYIVGQRTYENGGNTITTNYEYLLDKSNVIFNTITTNKEN